MRHVGVAELVVIERKVRQERESQLTAITICGVDVLGFGHCTAGPRGWYETHTGCEVHPMQRVSRQVRLVRVVRSLLRSQAGCGGNIGGRGHAEQDGGVENIHGSLLRQ